MFVNFKYQTQTITAYLHGVYFFFIDKGFSNDTEAKIFKSHMYKITTTQCS